MKKLVGASFFAVIVLLISACLVRLWMQLIIWLPITDDMMNFALELYGAENQEQSADALSWLGIAIVLPPVTFICWVAIYLWNCRRPRGNLRS
jgi:hypothetical protein